MIGRYENSRPVVKLLQWLGMMLSLTIVAVALWLLLPDRQSVSALKILQALQSAATFLLPPLIMACLWSRRPAEYLRLQNAPSLRSALLVITVMLVAMPAINLLSHINQQLTLPAFLGPLEQVLRQMEEQAEALTESFLCTSSFSALFANILVLALLPALGEELTFRALLLNAFTRSAPQRARMPHAAIWATAILFSALHLQFYGFLPRMLIGALFGYILCFTGNLWLTVIMHFTNNAVAVVSYFVITRHNLTASSGVNASVLEELGTGSTLWLGVLSVCLTLSAVILFRKKACDS